MNLTLYSYSVRMTMGVAVSCCNSLFTHHSPERSFVFPDVGENSRGATESDVWILDGRFVALPSAPDEQNEVVGWMDPPRPPPAGQR